MYVKRNSRRVSKEEKYLNKLRDELKGQKKFDAKTTPFGPKIVLFVDKKEMYNLVLSQLAGFSKDWYLTMNRGDDQLLVKMIK